MFRSKTVFILGAGASEEVGLPIGNDLKKKIAQKIDIRFDYVSTQISGDYQIMQALREHTMLPNRQLGNPNPYLYAAWKLRDALPQAISIDNLLDAYRGDELSETCGKLGIISSILEAEKASTIYCNPTKQQKINFGSLDQTWFAGFVKILTENVPQRDVENIFDNVGILNFNYDRCIEHYLHESLQNYYDLEANAVSTLINRIQILHPYGSVGKLTWQNSSNTQVLYGSERSNLLALAKQIKTFNERVHETDEITQIRSMVQQAEIIVFLGFAFHRQNLELIAPGKACKAKRIYATAHGISKSDCAVIQDELRDMLMQRGNKASIEFRNDLKCGGLFNEYWRSLTAGL